MNHHRRPYATYDPAISRTGRRLLNGYLGLVLVFLYTPMLVLVLFSFNDAAIPAFPLSGFTTKWYSALFENEQMIATIVTSGTIAAYASIVTLVIAAFASLGIARNRFAGRTALYVLLLSPMIMPFLVMAVSLLLFFRAARIPLSQWTVVAGHSMMAMPYVLLILVPRLAKIDPSLEEAAQDLGCSRVSAYWFVLRPLMTPAIVAGFFVALTTSFDEFPIASLVNDGSKPTFPVFLFGQARFPDRLPQVIAVATIIIAVTLLVVLVGGIAQSQGIRRVFARLRSKEAT